MKMPRIETVPPNSAAVFSGSEEQPNARALATLKKSLHQLRSLDADVRVKAFSRLRSLPKPWLQAGYEQFRQITPTPGFALDCLERMEVLMPDPPIVCDRCLCTVVSPGYEVFLEAFLDTFWQYGRSPDVSVVVFALDEAYHTLAHRRNIIRIQCRSKERLSPAVKGVVYSAARFIQARQILACEADILVVGSLQPLWAALDVAHPGAVLGARAQTGPDRMDLRSVLRYAGAPETDLEFITGLANYNCPFRFNGGVLAGGREAFLHLDAQIRRLCPFLILWVEGGFHGHYADECAMNLCVDLLGNHAELHPTFNQQFYSMDRDHWLETSREAAGLRFQKEGVPSRVLHFVSPNRDLMWQVKSEIDEFGVLPIEAGAMQ